MSGIVYLVGAGPGDPELLTLKGLRLLKTADVVVYDRLVSPSLLDLIEPGAMRVSVGKAGGGPSTPQADINALLVRLGRAGRTVVRLKGGDPFLFGRGGEEALALRAAGVPFEIVPGVSAGNAGPAYAGIPVTHRGLARSVAYVTGHVARRLVDAGRAADTPVAIVLDASLPHQEVRTTDLDSVATHGAGPLDGRPALLVVGHVASLAADLAWFADAEPSEIALAGR